MIPAQVPGAVIAAEIDRRIEWLRDRLEKSLDATETDRIRGRVIEARSLKEWLHNGAQQIHPS